MDGEKSNEQDNEKFGFQSTLMKMVLLSLKEETIFKWKYDKDIYNAVVKRINNIICSLKMFRTICWEKSKEIRSLDTKCWRTSKCHQVCTSASPRCSSRDTVLKRSKCSARKFVLYVTSWYLCLSYGYVTEMLERV